MSRNIKPRCGLPTLRSGEPCTKPVGHGGYCFAGYRPIKRSEKTCVECGGSFIGPSNEATCSPECRKAMVAKRSVVLRAQKVAVLRTKAAAIKVERGCIDCGYNAHSVALDFDHRPGVDKVNDIAILISLLRPWEEVQLEIDKCDVRCANCHRVKTAQRRSPTVLERTSA